jgi:YidC/Oxa1 family membrane protein insertase
VNFLATTGIVHFFGTIFAPVYHFFAWIMASLYGVIPNYAVDIALFTLIIMVVLTPLTVKSTKSMMAMQQLQPELKKLQQKYKGPENRQILNEELMKLYREAGVNPLGSCLPMLLQMPFLLVLYGVIKGLANLGANGKSAPRYIPHSSAMYHNLIATNGQIKAFGMDLGLKVTNAHGSLLAAVPFYLFVLVAVGAQYFQMWQMNNRSKLAGNVVPKQQQTITRLMPIIFVYIYVIIPAAVVLYMIISTGIRIITQDVMFRMGVSDPRKQKERTIPGRVVEDVDDATPAIGNGAKPNKPANKVAGKTVAKKTVPPTHPRSKAKKKRKVR